jgi:hypothetical protein
MLEEIEEEVVTMLVAADETAELDEVAEVVLLEIALLLVALDVTEIVEDDEVDDAEVEIA